LRVPAGVKNINGGGRKHHASYSASIAAAHLYHHRRKKILPTANSQKLYGLSLCLLLKADG